MELDVSSVIGRLSAESHLCLRYSLVLYLLTLKAFEQSKRCAC